MIAAPAPTLSQQDAWGRLWNLLLTAPTNETTPGAAPEAVSGNGEARRVRDEPSA